MGLRVGRRVAFDTLKGLLWVVCTRCEQWNLVPIEERWEAVASCDRLASDAEIRSGTRAIGFARAASGLELLRAGGLSDPDIANWRYGRRLTLRQSAIRWLGGALGVLALTFGLRAGVELQSLPLGGYFAALALVWIGIIWRNPPRLPGAAHLGSKRSLIWPWQRNAVWVDVGDDREHPAVVVPRRSGAVRLVGHDAARFLADILPTMNGSSCAQASIEEAVARVTAAERGQQKRASVKSSKARRRARQSVRTPDPPLVAWELVLASEWSTTLNSLPAVTRLALEMAATEEVERAVLESHTREIEPTLAQEDSIAAIADDLLVPEEVRAQLRKLHEAAATKPAAPSAPEDDPK